MKNLLLVLFISTASICVGQEYDIYVSDAGDFQVPPWQILKFDQDGQNGEVFINSHLGWPQDILFLEDKNEVLISNFTNNNITKYKADSGEYLGIFASGISGPTRMKIGPDSMLYVLQWTGNGLVKKFDLEGNPLGNFTNLGIGTSIGIAWDSNQNMYISSYNDKYVQKYDSNGKFVSKIISQNLAGPTNIWIDSNNELLVADYNSGIIKRYDLDGKFIENYITGIPQCEGVDFLPNGNLLIGHGKNSSVDMFDENGSFIKNLIAPKSTNLKTPNAVRIRYKNTTSTKDYTANADFISPTIGSHFTINNSDLLSYLDSLKVYDIAGKLIVNIAGSNDFNWDASGELEGIYIIRAFYNDGSQMSQKVVVKY